MAIVLVAAFSKTTGIGLALTNMFTAIAGKLPSTL